MNLLKQLTTFVLCSLLLASLTACQIPTATPAAAAPILTVREATNCRNGPGTRYDIVFTYPPGTRLPVAGRDETADFWLVKSDKSPTGSCWMWGGSVDVTGSPQPVTNEPPAASPTGSQDAAGPAAPSLQSWDYSCDTETLTFTVTWKDRASDETGYRIFRNGKQVAELPANSTNYTATVNLSTVDQPLEYYVQVYGPSGATNSSVMKLNCL